MYISLILQEHKLYDLIVLKLTSESNRSKTVIWMEISVILEFSEHKLYNFRFQTRL